MKTARRFAAIILIAVLLLPGFASAAVDSGSGSTEPKTYTGDYMLLMSRYRNGLSGAPFSVASAFSNASANYAPEALEASFAQIEEGPRAVDPQLWMDVPEHMLQPADRPIANFRPLAEGEGNDPVVTKPGDFDIGGVRDFIIYQNGSSSSPATMEFTLVYKNTDASARKCTIWVPSDTVSVSDGVVTPVTTVPAAGGGTTNYVDVATAVGVEFDSNIHSNLAAMFGDVDTDMNNDGSATFLLYDCGGANSETYVAGFFFGGDMNDLPACDYMNGSQPVHFPGFTSGTYRSNQMDIMHLNINTIPKNGISRLKSTLAHEFVHLIVYANYRNKGVTGFNSPISYGNMPAWINEGIAQAAEHRIYGVLSDRISQYNTYSPSYAHRMLMPYSFANVSDHEALFLYAQSYLIQMYLQSRAAAINDTDGTEIFRAMLNSNYLRVVESESDANTANSKFVNVVKGAVNDADTNFKYTVTVQLMLDFNLATILKEMEGVYGFGKYAAEFEGLRRQPTSQSVMNGIRSGSTKLYAGGSILVPVESGEFTFDMSGFKTNASNSEDGSGQTDMLYVRGVTRSLEYIDAAGRTVTFNGRTATVGSTTYTCDNYYIYASGAGRPMLEGTTGCGILLTCSAGVQSGQSFAITSGGRLEIADGCSLSAGGTTILGEAVIEVPDLYAGPGEASSTQLEYGVGTAVLSTGSPDFFAADGAPTLSSGGLLSFKPAADVTGADSAVVRMAITNNMFADITVHAIGVASVDEQEGVTTVGVSIQKTALDQLDTVIAFYQPQEGRPYVRFSTAVAYDADAKLWTARFNGSLDAGCRLFFLRSDCSPCCPAMVIGSSNFPGTND